MKAVLFEHFGGPLHVGTVDDPVPDPHGVVVRVLASGICRSDWHGWMGHDPDIVQLPHIPGHELAGVIEEAGSDVVNWKAGDRVTVPFVCGCGECRDCATGNMQVCGRQYQPGFTGAGSFAERVALPFAETNLVSIPEEMDSVAAASLGCRFATAFRAVVAQGRVREGDWVAVHGAGGVGLSAIMIAKALGARVLAVDIKEDARARAKEFGADAVIDGARDVVGEIRELSDGGAGISIDALGSVATCGNSIRCLRNRGRHVQIGLMVGKHADPPVPMGEVIARELELFGSHGMSAAGYPRMLEMVTLGRLDPRRLVERTVTLEQAPAVLERMGEFADTGISVIEMV